MGQDRLYSSHRPGRVGPGEPQVPLFSSSRCPLQHAVTGVHLHLALSLRPVHAHRGWGEDKAGKESEGSGGHLAQTSEDSGQGSRNKDRGVSPLKPPWCLSAQLFGT